MYGRGPDFDSRSKVLHRHDEEVSYARSSPLDHLAWGSEGKHGMSSTSLAKNIQDMRGKM